MAMVKDYLKKTKEYKISHGEKTVVLYQCGSFFEVYGIKDKQGNITGSDIVEVAGICDLHIANKLSGEGTVVMSGFGLPQLDKYVKKLTDEGWTVPVIVQDTPGSNTTRSLKIICSPGTNFLQDDSKLSNNIACIWIEKTTAALLNLKKPHLQCGMSNIDIYTGKAFINQFEGEYLHNPATYDDLERFISIYNPNEALLIHNLNKKEITDVINFSGLSSRKIHLISLLEENNNVKTCKNCEKQVYQKEQIKRFYPEADFDVIFDKFYYHDKSTQAYCYLLNFLYESNPNLVNKIQEPIFETNTDKLVLANHSLKQLNIVDDRNYIGKCSSISRFLNNCITPMGKRYFIHMLLHPTTREEFLEREYSITEYFMENNDKFSFLRGSLREIRDMEKLNRRVIMKEITPYQFYTVNESINIIKTINNKLINDETLKDYFFEQFSLPECIEDNCNKIEDIIGSTLDISICKQLYSSPTYERNFIKRGVFKNLDELVEKWHDNIDQLEAIRKYLNGKLVEFETKKTKNATDIVKIHETEKSGSYVQTTARRATILSNKLGSESEVSILYISTYDGEERNMLFNCNDLRFETASGSNKNIVNAQITSLTKNILTSKSTMLDEVQIRYRDFVMQFVENTGLLEQCSLYISILDNLQNKAYIANTYNYSRPRIDSASDKSYVDCKGLKHPLIEHLNKNELYVPNDICIGKEMSGMLIYGTNAVGKTSLIRALGISIVMAQAGLFVPCKEYLYKPYQHIFTRILGNDNIFKGLSTFAVEMSELRTILKFATQNSLILGDELCSGTETESATSIFIAGVDSLHNRESSFVFATHFHEITDREEITKLTKLGLRHMTVRFDKERDLLIYDRILKEGPGDSMYGLEVCKALNLPDEFLEYAHQIRIKYNDSEQSVLSMKSSRYNNEKIKGLCEMCLKSGIRKKADEIHHMLPQKDAEENGYIGSNHKNHPANLMSLCKKCHSTLTKTGKKLKRKTSSQGSILEEV